MAKEETGTELFFQRKDEPKESGEDENLDTSEVEESEQEGEEEAEEQDVDTEEEEADTDEEEPGYKAKFEKAEQQRKEWQSRFDTTTQQYANQIKELTEKVSQLTEKQDSKEIEDVFAGREPDDLPTIAEIQKLEEKRSKQKAVPQKDDFDDWSRSQSDLAVVSEYYSTLKATDPLVDNKIPGANAKEKYITLRQWIVEDDNAILRKKIEKLEKQAKKIKKSKPKVPISGAGIGVTGGTRSTGRDPNIHSFFQQKWNK